MKSEIQLSSNLRSEDVFVEKENPQGLRKDIEFYKAIIHALPDLVWLKDPEGIYLSCNKRFADFTETTEPEIIGKTDYDLFDVELANFFREHDKKAIQKSSPSTNEE